MHSRVVTRQFSKKNTSTNTPPERSSLGAHQPFRGSGISAERNWPRKIKSTQCKKWYEKNGKGSGKRPQTYLKSFNPLSCCLKICHQHFSKNASPSKICTVLFAPKTVCRSGHANIARGGKTTKQKNIQNKNSSSEQVLLNYSAGF